jgi:hypothetical protein
MPKTVNDFILPNEEVKFIATYDVRNSNRNPGNNEFSGSSGLVTDVAGVCAFSFIQRNYLYNTTGLLGGSRYIFENYALSSTDEQNNSEYLGDCVWQASYPDKGSTGVTTVPILCFGVSSSTGIYSGLTKVVIDFTNVNRVLYLIGNKTAV